MGYGLWVRTGARNRTSSCVFQVVAHGCNAHDTYHASEGVLRRLDYVNEMSCTSSVLRSGPVYRDLLNAMWLDCQQAHSHRSGFFALQVKVSCRVVSHDSMMSLLSATRLRKAAMRQRFKVKFGKPEPEHRAYAKKAIDVAFLASADAANWSRYEAHSAAAKSQTLLRLLNGDWRELDITHVCCFGCCQSNEASWSQAGSS